MKENTTYKKLIVLPYEQGASNFKETRLLRTP